MTRGPGGPVLDHTFEAIVCGWETAAVPTAHGDTAAVGSHIEALCAAGIHVFVMSASPVDRLDDQLRARPSGPGRLHLCVDRGAEVFAVAQGGIRSAWKRRVTSCAAEPTDESGSLRWAAAWLARRGISGGLVLVAGGEFGPVDGAPGRDSPMLVPELQRAVIVSVGDEPGGVLDGVLHLGGGPARLLDVFAEQLGRRREGRVPHVDDDPSWVIPLPDDPTRERVAEALGALGNGFAGMRASREEDGASTGPLFVVNGVYTNETVPRLLEGPVWENLAVQDGGLGGRRLDLRTGVLARTDDQSGIRTLRFVSAARPHALALRAEGPTIRLDAGTPFESDVDAPMQLDRRPAAEMARTSTPDGGGIVVAVRNRVRTSTGLRTVERFGAWAADPAQTPPWDDATADLSAVEAVGFDRSLAEHRAAWARRWEDAEVSIEGDHDDQLAARFAVFHLLNAAPDSGEAAVGPRGLTGHGYGGHVFWDADVYVLPALAAIRPGAARAMLEYRVRRLPAAREAAGRLRLDGARFPWESARDGTDVTPPHVTAHDGERLPVRTGLQQEHIVGDVAWAANEYAAWSGDVPFLLGPGRDLVVDTARYWASRIRRDRDGHAHIYGVMGPDEYHEAVDDNAYTNLLARWNLRRAAELVTGDGADDEASLWVELADRLVDGWDPRRHLHEQFAGYWDLEPLLAEQVARRPFAADLVLGRKRVSGSQLIKQPDVVMLHHLIPDDLHRGSLGPDVAFYEPRTSHGSSLSPAIYAAVLARAGHPDAAIEPFRLAARLDLDDLTATTATGVHLATMGGLWQALAYGFLGLRPRRDHLAVDPRLPRDWRALSLRLRFHDSPVTIRAEHDALHIECRGPLAVRVSDGPIELCTPPGRTFRLDHPGAHRPQRSDR